MGLLEQYANVCADILSEFTLRVNASGGAPQSRLLRYSVNQPCDNLS